MNKAEPFEANPRNTSARSGETVFLVDDNFSVRRALTRLIQSAGHRVAAFASVPEFLDSDWHNHVPACLVSDVQLPGPSGLDLQRELRAKGEVLPTIFITAHGDIPMGVKAMKDGAVDFLPKPVTDTDLLAAIGRALDRAAHELSEREEISNIRRRADTLTSREHQVMALVVEGWLNKQIAFELGTAEKTIKVHRARAMQKMKAASLAELVRMAGKIGIPPRPMKGPN